MIIRLFIFLAFLFLGAFSILRAQDLSAPTPSESSLLDQADSIFQEVSRLRGLPIKYPVKKELKDQGFFSNYFRSMLQGQYPPEKKAALEKAYVFYGFLSPGTDLVESDLSAMLKDVQGVYDPQAKTLYLADWVGQDYQEEVLAHELTHALQDQYFDLGRYVGQEKGASMDYQFAHDSVMEGEAVAIALDYTLQEKGKEFTQLKDIGDATRLSDQLNESGQRAFGREAALPDVAAFPYVYGTAFLQKYVKAYGWQGMGYLFEHPPTSTHQILHPETFFPQRHNPLKVEIEDLSGAVLPRRTKLWEDSFGEYGISLALARYLPAGQSRDCVKKWQGDQFQLYEGPGYLTAIGYVVLEDEASAVEFYEAARSYVGLKYHLRVAGSKGTDLFRLALGDTGLEACVERRGKRVALIEGTQVRETNQVRTALWNVKKRKMSQVKSEARGPE